MGSFEIAHVICRCWSNTYQNGTMTYPNKSLIRQNNILFHSIRKCNISSKNTTNVNSSLKKILGHSRLLKNIKMSERFASKSLTFASLETPFYPSKIIIYL